MHGKGQSVCLFQVGHEGTRHILAGHPVGLSLSQFPVGLIFYLNLIVDLITGLI